MNSKEGVQSEGHFFTPHWKDEYMHSWVLLHYKIPNKPSAKRVYIWRKMKNIGAILLHDAVWVLPHTSRNLEQFQWLSIEIAELGGQSMFWQGQVPLIAQEELLVKQFTANVDKEYAKILEALKGEDAGLRALSAQYQQVKTKDYFQSEIGKQVYLALITSREAEWS